MKHLPVLLLIFISVSGIASTDLNLELGWVNNSYNKVKISGDEGTLFNLRPALDSDVYYRLGLSHKFNSPHGIRLLYAPLKLSGIKTYSEDIQFSGEIFQSGEKTEAEYQFNSYRASYFYEWISRSDFILRAGGTLKVRDARVELKQENVKEDKKNIGLVPLLYLYSEYKWDNKMRIAFDFDGLAAPQGRAFDVAIMAGRYLSSHMNLNFGYRILEGGVDNDDVYNFSQINYYFLSFQYGF